MSGRSGSESFPIVSARWVEAAKGEHSVAICLEVPRTSFATNVDCLSTHIHAWCRWLDEKDPAADGTIDALTWSGTELRTHYAVSTMPLAPLTS